MIRFFLAFLLTFSVLSCAPMVDVEFDRKIDFSLIRSYNYYPSIASGLDPLEDEMIIEIIDSILPQKFLTKTENPQVYVNFYTNEEARYYDTLGADYYAAVITSQDFTLDLVDVEKDELLWRGQIRGEITEGINNRQLEKYYIRMIEELFKKYPPKK